MINYKGTFKRSLSMLLAVLMLIGMFPASVFAEAGDVYNPNNQSQRHTITLKTDTGTFSDGTNEKVMPAIEDGFVLTSAILNSFPQPSKDSYKFEGWTSVAPESGEVASVFETNDDGVLTSVTVKGDITLKAKLTNITESLGAADVSATGVLYVYSKEGNKPTALVAEEITAESQPRLKATEFDPTKPIPAKSYINEWTFVKALDKDAGWYYVKVANENRYLNINQKVLSVVEDNPQAFFVRRDDNNALRLQSSSNYGVETSYAVNLRNKASNGFQGSNWFNFSGGKEVISEDSNFNTNEAFFITNLTWHRSLTVKETIKDSAVPGGLTDAQKNSITFTIYNENYSTSFTYGQMTNGSYTLNNLPLGVYTVKQEVDIDGVECTAVTPENGTTVVDLSEIDYTGKKVTTVTFTYTFKGAVQIKFAAAGGTAAELPGAQTVNGGVPYILPDYTGTRTGYSFLGWSDGENTFQPGDSYTIPADKNEVTFTAVWGYIVSFDANGVEGLNLPSDIVFPENSSSMEIDFSTGYELTNENFVGWSTKKDGKIYPNENNNVYPVTETVTFYAIWRNSATVTFDIGRNKSANVTLPDSITDRNVGDTITLPTLTLNNEGTLTLSYTHTPSPPPHLTASPRAQ